jgi:hypothetical protein
MSKSPKQQPTELADVPTAPESLATNQQSIPLPLFVGERKIAARWITGVLKWSVHPAPSDSAKK